MARFGLFAGLFSEVPQQTVEGDYMVQDGEYVRIFRTSLDPSRADAEVAAFRLNKTQVVREIDETGQRAQACAIAITEVMRNYLG